ncbi:MAG: OmpA family protein [Ottowia sp.]|nr:OmpA family protein [Ottowia sp.]
MLRVFFGSGKSAVPKGFATHAAALKAWLDEHEGAKLAISGFNDPTGNAAANAELAKQRAENVRDALAAAGIAAERLSLEKPQDATDDDVSLAEARRVEVKVSE